MTIKDLISALTPPSAPVETHRDNKWSDITDRLGFPLPYDYTKFIDTYGPGEIGGWLSVFNPFSENPYHSLIDQFFSSLSSLSLLKIDFPDAVPYPLLFEPGGLLPWGLSIDGDLFCWATTGTNGRWPVVIICKDSQPEEYKMSFS